MTTTEYYFANTLAALLVVQEGNKERAVECMSSATNLPFVTPVWHTLWSLPSRVRDRLRVELPSDVYEAAWERGKALPMDAVAKELLSDAVN